MTDTVRRPRFGLKALLLTASLFVLLPATDASAGRLLVTGHDWDYHCGTSTEGGSQCHYTKVGVKFVRAGSAKKVLILDRADFDLSNALDNAFGADIPRRIIEPTSDAWDTVRLTPKKFSAILIASDESCGGCDLNPGGTTVDSQAINSRKGAIKRFFNKGGGIMVGAGADHGDGDPTTGPDNFYNFVPIPVGGQEVTDPFCLTNVGIKLGFHDQDCPNPARHNGTEDDINCCPTHNSFSNPDPGSALKVAERDANGFAETMIARGKIRGDKIVQDMRLTVKPKEAPEGKRTCFRFRVRSEGDPVRRATVKFGGKKGKTNARGRVTICTTFGESGRQTARATKRGFAPASTRVRIFPSGAEPCRC